MLAGRKQLALDRVDVIRFGVGVDTVRVVDKPVHAGFRNDIARFVFKQVFRAILTWAVFALLGAFHCSPLEYSAAQRHPADTRSRWDVRGCKRRASACRPEAAMTERGWATEGRTSCRKRRSGPTGCASRVASSRTR